MSAKRIVMLGAPGAGKGTQATRLAGRIGGAHVSTGDMLRTAVASGTEVGKRAKAVMDAGQLVSDEIVISIARERLAQADAEPGFVLDGFPRTHGQAQALTMMLKDLSAPLDCCLALTVDVGEVVGRILRRAELEGRTDDNEEAVRERMRVYSEQTAPLMDFYEQEALLVTVDGMGTMDEVASRIEEAVL